MINIEDIEIDHKKKLGSGYTAKVFKGVHKRTNQEFAVK